jgi:hypothetical protein
MKKNILLAIAAVLFGMCLSAQSEPGFDLGASGSANSIWILRQNNYGTLAPFANSEVRESEMAYKNTYGGNGGICLGYRFTKNWGLQAELQYATAGQNYDDNFEGPATIPEGTFGGINSRVNVQRTVKLSYLQIPIMAKFMVGKKKFKFFACLGPQIGIRTSAYEQVKIAGYVYLPDSLNFTADQKFQKVDFGFAIQTGAQFHATPHLYFELGLSFYQGVTDINGTVLQNLGWYDKNHLSYQKSYNFRGGLMLGIHYVFWHERGGILEISKPEAR